MNNSDTDDSDDGANRSGNDYGGGDDVGTENDATRVDHTIQQIPDSDADATRFEPLDTEGDAQSSDDDDDNNHLDMPRFTSRKEDNPGRIRSFNPDGTEILPKAMARRTGRKVIETKSGKSKTIGRAEFDGDGLGPPLSTLKSAELSRRNSTLSPIKSAGLKRSIRNSLTTPGSGPALRRSGRSSTDPAVRKITVGEYSHVDLLYWRRLAMNSVVSDFLTDFHRTFSTDCNPQAIHSPLDPTKNFLKPQIQSLAKMADTSLTLR